MKIGPIRFYPIELLAGFVCGLALMLALWDWRQIVVLEDIKATSWTYGPAHDLAGWVAVDVTGIKSAGCAFLPSKTEGYALVDGEWQRVAFEFLLDRRLPQTRAELLPGRTRQLGYQNFGSWFWPASPAVERLALDLEHSCSGERVRTRLEFSPTL
jgi:hypothetical protein